MRSSKVTMAFAAVGIAASFSVFGGTASAEPTPSSSSSPALPPKEKGNKIATSKGQLPAAEPAPSRSATEPAPSGSSSKNADFFCRAGATDPFTLTPTSLDIYAEGVITTCLGNPDACSLTVDLEQYDGNIGQWNVVAHTPGVWGDCKQGKRVNAKYKCTHDQFTEWGYRTSIYLVAEKDGMIGNVGHAYSENHVLHNCH